LFNFVDQTARQFVLQQLRRSTDFGIKGGNYELRKTVELDKPIIHPKWKPTKIPDFMEQQVKAKQHVPHTFYNISGTMINRKNSNLCKERRRLLSDQIIDFQKKYQVPGPGAHNPSLKT
jgi:hypothetical protein